MSRLIILIFAISFFSSCEEPIALSDAFGNFEATATTVSSEATGRLLFLKIEEGQKLKAGALIALVDTTQLDLQRKQIQATINTLPKKLRNDLADIEVMKNQRANLIRERDRVRRLVDKKAATTKQLDDLNGEVDVLGKRIAAIQSQTQTANRSIMAEKGPMLAQIDLVNEQIRKSYIYNPVEGTVLTKLSEPSEMVALGTPLYRIGELDTLTLRFYASAVQLQAVKLGQSLEVLIDKGTAHYTRLDGMVSWISEQAEFTPKTIQTKEDRVNLVYAVKAKVPNPDGLLKIGMPAEVNFEKTTAERAQVNN